MEPAKLKVTHIPCPLHEEDIIRRVRIDSKSDVSPLCGECIACSDGNQKQVSFIFENFLKQIAHPYTRIPKLQQLPDSTYQILSTENEILVNFSHHIERQKEQVDIMIDKLRQSVYQKLEIKKRQLKADLDAQVKTFEEILLYYKQTVLSYKEKDNLDDKSQDQEAVPTFETLYKEVSKVTNAEDLKKYLQREYEKMRKIEIFAHVNCDIAKKIVTDALEEMDTEFRTRYNLKPTISLGVNNEDFEEISKKWSEQVDTAITRLKIDIKDPVKAIKFQLQSFFVDSVILKNDLENHRMVADWVSETLKSIGGSFDLLYRGSRDGFGAKNFHKKCDNKGPTIVIIENTSGNKFGGYAAVSWTSMHQSNQSKDSFSSFLFSIDKKEKLPYKPESGSQVLCRHSGYGPIFGASHTLLIDDKCNANNNSYYDPECESYQGLKEGGYISGTKYFTVKEIEVYSVAPL